MTKKESQCQTMADVCELAHERTVRECKKLGIAVDCENQTQCKDVNQVHGDKEFTHYNEQSQRIFNEHYDYICEVTKI